MTPSEPQRRAQGAKPESGKQQAPAIHEPWHRTGGRPDYVIEIWASPQLRERNPDRPLSVCEALEVGRDSAPGGEPEPDSDPEPEP